jgi:hypothetical protein
MSGDRIVGWLGGKLSGLGVRREGSTNVYLGRFMVEMRTDERVHIRFQNRKAQGFVFLFWVTIYIPTTAN